MNDTLLEEAIEAWEDARNGVIAEVENIPAEQFDFRPAEGVRTVSELALHIMEVSLMMAGELTRDDGDFQRKPFPKLIAEYVAPLDGLRGKRAILAALRATLRDGVKQLRSAGEVHMLQRIRRFDGQYGTRLAWMHHGIDQEMYHRGQLALYQRLMGLTPALTKRIRGEA
jgi:uncharacterized damage-inducible protein DinB